ncbi:MAG: ABC transporter permease [Planctomycetota bacterium]|nr:ABC transporter permease [Planctomycetota bacterium]
MQSIIQDTKIGFRGLMKTPGFTLAATLCLALGFGANTAIFSIVNAVLLRPLPYPKSQEIVQILIGDEVGNASLTSALEFDFSRERSRAYEKIAALDSMVGGYNITYGEGRQAVRADGYQVTAEYFDVLGVRPALGRTFHPGDDEPGAAPMVVLSHSIWRRQFNANPDVVGLNVELNNVPYTVLGVMPENFQSYPASDLWLPLAYKEVLDVGSYNYQVLARLKSDTTLQAAQVDANRVGWEFAAAHPEREGQSQRGLLVHPFQDMVVGNSQLPLLLLGAAVGLVLLIACANVAHLLMARSTDRKREMAVRVALGAPRGRLIRQLMTESVLLALLSGLLGLLLAFWSFDILLALMPQDLPRREGIALDGPVLGFSLIVSVLTGLIFGLVPVIHTFSLDVINSLKDGAGRSSSGGHRNVMRGLLVSSEVALSLVLLIGAGLLMQTFYRLSSVDPGFKTDHVLTAQLSMTDVAYASTRPLSEFRTQLKSRLDGLPGVKHVAMSSNLPLEQPLNLPIALESWTERMVSVEYRLISPEYFQALGIALRKGRVFTHHDTSEAPAVVIVNETFARRYFEHDDSIRQRLTVKYIADRTRDVVGVVADVREFGLATDAPATIYLPYDQAPDEITKIVNSFLPMNLVLRTEGDPMALAGALQGEIETVDSSVPLSNVRSMTQVHASSIAEQRFRMILIGAFALLALLLSAVGLYGVTSYAVAQRTREIGIRIALGAKPGSVQRLVILKGLQFSVVGIVIGTVGALILTRYMANLLYDVSPTDPLTIGGLGALMLGLVTLASYLPARRAARIDPLVALRQE